MSKKNSESENPGEAGCEPVGDVVVLATNSKTGVRVLMDDKRVWKEAGKLKKGE